MTHIQNKKDELKDMGEVVLKRVNVSQFLRQYESKHTKKSYRAGLKQFFKLMYPDGGDLDALSERYLDQHRDYREDMLNFKDSLKDKAPTTKATRFNSIRTFLDDNGITFPKRFFKNLNGKATEPITYEDVPDSEELKRIVEYMPIHGKAMTLFLASSGMRIGESVELMIEDVEFDHDPAKIRIRGVIAKTGRKRIAFISPEAKEAVEEWLTFRDQYFKTATKRSKKYTKAEDRGRLFPFSTSNFNVIWKNALVKAKLAKIDEKTNRLMMRPHNLRKYFRLRVGRFGRDEAEALMGHQKGLNAVYARFEGEDGEKRLEEIYVKSIPELSIYGRSVIIQKADKAIRDDLKRHEDAIDILLREKHVREIEIRRLNEEMESYKTAHSNLEKTLIDIVEKQNRRIENLRGEVETLMNPEFSNKGDSFKDAEPQKELFKEKTGT